MYVYSVTKKLSALMDRCGLPSVFQKVSHFELAQFIPHHHSVPNSISNRWAYYSSNYAYV
jgi:hypothetical protein